VCEYCFGPLEVVYNYDSMSLDQNSFNGRPKTLWRYSELLPITDHSKIVDLGTGFTPLHEANRLAKEVGLKKLYIKDDSVNPTNSFKDRPASVAVSKAFEFEVKAVGCASTGNLGAAVAAHAAKARLPCYIFIPTGLEFNKIIQVAIYGATIITVNGTYDDANRLAAQASEQYDLALANINIRPYYVEGSKTLAFEVCEQLNWSPPDHVIVPLGSGALLCALGRGLDEFDRLGLIENSNTRITGVQAEGCAPIADEDTIEAIKLLARTEGIFTEPAGGVSIAAVKKLVDSGKISTDEVVVCYVTGNGLKTPEAVLDHIEKPIEIEPTLDSLYKVF